MKITKANTSDFSGDLQRTRIMGNVIMTPGVLFVAQHGGSVNKDGKDSGAFWLAQAIASYMPNALKGKYGEDFKYMSFWKVKVNPDKSCVLTGDDGNGNVKVKQNIEYADFECDDDFTIYAQYDEKYVTLMLPSEY